MLLWDMNIQCDNVIEARRPDILLIDTKERRCIIISIAVPTDGRAHEKEREKVEKYEDLRRKIGRLWQLRKVQVVPVVMYLSSAFPGRGTPGLPGGNHLKLKKSAPQYRGLSGLLGLFLARGLGTFSGISGWLPLSLLT